MQTRPTVRVLLLDSDNRLLLIKCTNLGLRGAPPEFWMTVGGGIEPGETIEAAALRETFEETGILAVELGPIVWYGETVLESTDFPAALFQQSYIVARCVASRLASTGWTQLERDTILELRWWTLDELRATTEHMFPPGLAGLLPDVLAGHYPSPPRVIDGP